MDVSPLPLTTPHVAPLVLARITTGSDTRNLWFAVFFFGSPYGFMHEEQKIDSYPNITPNSKQFESLYCHVEVVKATPTRTYFGEIFLKLLFEWFCFLHPSPSLAQDLFLGKKNVILKYKYIIHVLCLKRSIFLALFLS